MKSFHSLFPIVLAAFCSLVVSSCGHERQILLPGKMPDGRVRLPNGWYLSPAGTQIEIGELPLNIAITPDERFLLVTNNGTKEQSISVVDVGSWKVVETVPLKKSWLGLRLYDAGKRFLLSGGNDNRIDMYRFNRGHALLIDSVILGAPWPENKIWVTGIDVDEATSTAYVAAKENNSLYVIDLNNHRVDVRVELSAAPYTCLVSSTHPTVYISLWGGSAIAVFDRSHHTLRATIPVGDHPCDMVESPDGKRLFVANANQNTVSVIDLDHLRVIETISSALSPTAPNGSTPNALAITPDGTRLYIANADNNYLAVMDISVIGSSRSLGFIPTGWYPTSVKSIHGGSAIVVASAKGGSSRANPRGPNPEKPNPSEDYIGSMFHGTLSICEAPGPQLLAGYTAQVYANSPYTDAKRDRPGSGEPSPIPSYTGGPSPIKYIFYVIKENRTYDQVFGDLPRGNGDSSLCLFPERVTPNHHALAREFVLLDNLYCDAEVSADGHNWSMGAYATDAVEKTWPTLYGGRGGEYVYDGQSPQIRPSAGYLWDNCQRHGLSYRTYGEFATSPDRLNDSAQGNEPALAGHVAPFYRGWDLGYSDVDRVKAWMREFDEFEKSGELPRFCSFTLPNDHTSGTRTGSLTPHSYVAQNDLALGMLVDRLSHSRFWKECAIFVIEDDAQDGPDHVDAHRTVGLVISPYCRRGVTDSELYSTSSMVRTIELLLGLPPLSQFDASATPMYSSFAPTPDLTPYTTRAARVDITERNIAGAYGQERSDRMDFTRADAISEDDLNEILWKTIRGLHSNVPPPVRSAFVRVPGHERDVD